MPSRVFIFFAVFMQVIGSVYFTGQIILNIVGISTRPLPWQVAESLEIICAFALLFGLVMGIWLYRNADEQRKSMETALRRAGSAFQEVLDERFQEWKLSEAERDVALFLIKGASTAEIANMRNTSEGTIKAQNASIYKKAGVTGKTQLLSLFFEDMFQED